MSQYARQHASALARVKAKGARIVFSTTDQTRDSETGALGAPTTRTVSGYAVGLGEGNPETYTKLGLRQSAAPSLMVVCDTYGDTPPADAECEWGGVKHVARDVDPFAPDGRAIYSTVVVQR